jgi:hypothetical protein
MPSGAGPAQTARIAVAGLQTAQSLRALLAVVIAVCAIGSAGEVMTGFGRAVERAAARPVARLGALNRGSSCEEQIRQRGQLRVCGERLIALDA